jgi:branched-chain amino acid transport system ATP-binding protein
MLELRAIDAGYGPVQVLRGVSLDVPPGRITCLAGRNGAGKTTTLRAIMGLARLSAGTIVLDGEPIHAIPPHEVPRRGIGYVPQGRRLFPDLTVAETLEVGLTARAVPPGTRDRVLDHFPRLRERLRQRAGTLSGGEQQMLATARALCLAPRVLLLDEPTEGLQPSMVAAIRAVIVAMRAEGPAVLLVEQRLDAIRDLADHVVILETGRVVDRVDAEALRREPDRLRRKLGV